MENKFKVTLMGKNGCLIESVDGEDLVEWWFDLAKRREPNFTNSGLIGFRRFGTSNREFFVKERWYENNLGLPNMIAFENMYFPSELIIEVTKNS